MVYEKLQAIQSKMKAPKNLYNSFGKYNYRNAESILEAFKPYGKEYGLVLMLNDKVEQVGDRIYIKATATLFDVEDKTEIKVSAYAREPISYKGMTDSQITGATSSYARKYCLNGLFLLDDTKDPDTDEYRTEAENKQKKQNITADKATDSQIQTLLNVLNKKGVQLEEVLKMTDVKTLQGITKTDYNKVVLAVKDM